MKKLKKLNLAQPVLHLNGNPIVNPDGKSPTLGQELAVALVSVGTAGPQEIVSLAKALFDNKEVEMEEEALKNISDFLKKSSNLSNLVKAQILDVFDDLLKEEKEKD